ncbi:MAG: beta-ketoacyl-ACP synthase II [Coriobacteriales bacterium]|jgi:3-oxoacyl-[acyl-carrier-protein] synthase II
MDRRVVITGIGAVTPLGLDAPSTWEALKAGTNGIGPITRFDTEEFKVKVAAEVKGFDPLRYLTKQEVRHTDLNVQYAIAASDEALADAGLVIEGDKVAAGLAGAEGRSEQAPEARPEANIAAERVGTYIGSGIGGFITMYEQITLFNERGPRRVSPFMVPMMIANMATGEVSIRHHATGPTLPVVTACATSSHTVGEAFHAIRLGTADAILAGGTESPILPVSVAAFQNAMALTKNPDPQTACRPFDDGRDGFVMGEGAVVLVLEELGHALARGAKVYAEVVGYGNTADAYHITSPDPDADGITRAIRVACDEAGVDPSEGLYINAHGTSTKLNDASETKGFKRALGEDAARSAKISSSKSMTGHMLGATGAMEAMVCALTLRDGVVTPTIHLVDADPDCDLDYTPDVAVPFDARWALSTSLGFGGHNACLAFRKYE